MRVIARKKVTLFVESLRWQKGQRDGRHLVARS